jgi:hypothetical protein
MDCNKERNLVSCNCSYPVVKRESAATALHHIDVPGNYPPAISPMTWREAMTAQLITLYAFTRNGVSAGTKRQLRPFFRDAKDSGSQLCLQEQLPYEP